MRADRLLSLLMLLQARGRMTAQALADKLEVSVRTIYRDVDALSMAGVPVYAERGPGGGCALLDSYRTDLTGLTEDEVRALFMLSIPAPLAQLGVSGELRAALLKLSAALPAARRRDEARVRQRFYLDSAPWADADEPVPNLPIIHQAVWEDRRAYLSYRILRSERVEYLFDPYGLVAKAGVWYVICGRGGKAHTLRVSHLLDARLSDETFERPPDFDLEAHWSAWCADFEARKLYFSAAVRFAPDMIPLLPYYFGQQIHRQIVQANPPDDAGRITLTLRFESLEAARDRILSFGRGAEVLSPRALRASVIDFARQIVDFYG